MKKIRLRVVRGERSSEFGFRSSEFGGCVTGSGALCEEEWGELGEVAPPDHPGVGAGCFDGREVNVLGLEPVAELAVGLDQAVFGAAGDPKEVQLGVRFGIELGESGVVSFCLAPR